MIERLATTIVNRWERISVISPEKREIYIYGLDLTLSTVWIALLVVTISTVFGSLLYIILYYACFMPLRGYCGGLHAKTHWGCALMQCIAFSAVVSASICFSYFVGEIPYPAILAIFACLLFVVGRLAPAEHPGNPIDSDKRKKLKRNGLITIMLILVTVTALSYFGLAVYANIMVFATVIAIASMLFAKYGVSSEEDADEPSGG